jgi:hypothetical protein
MTQREQKAPIGEQIISRRKIEGGLGDYRPLVQSLCGDKILL